MNLHHTTFEYLKPTAAQMISMGHARLAVAQCADILNRCVPDGPDKTYAMRQLRDVLMWCNVAITREADGSPRLP